MKFLQLAQVRHNFLLLGDKQIISQVIKVSFIEIFDSISYFWCSYVTYAFIPIHMYVRMMQGDFGKFEFY